MGALDTGGDDVPLLEIHDGANMPEPPGGAPVHARTAAFDSSAGGGLGLPLPAAAAAAAAAAELAAQHELLAALAKRPGFDTNLPLLVRAWS